MMGVVRHLLFSDPTNRTSRTIWWSLSTSNDTLLVSIGNWVLAVRKWSAKLCRQVVLVVCRAKCAVLMCLVRTLCLLPSARRCALPMVMLCIVPSIDRPQCLTTTPSVVCAFLRPVPNCLLLNSGNPRFGTKPNR